MEAGAMQVIIMFLSSKTVDNMGGISDVLQEMCQYLRICIHK